MSDWINDTVSSLAPLTTAKEACAVLRTSRRNLSRMIDDGRLTAVKARETGSSHLLIPRVAIEKYLRGLAAL